MTGGNREVHERRRRKEAAQKRFPDADRAAEEARLETEIAAMIEDLGLSPRTPLVVCGPDADLERAFDPKAVRSWARAVVADDVAKTVEDLTKDIVVEDLDDDGDELLAA
jgi:hypothetical protein